ncbi:hypothetical protein DL93DRAFT_2232859 [Clavulina sp. PMI_390]|nr:hypothetical protein DL93DRAFT_2232859 [Clavulina sp. PMI_390]
MCSRCQHNGTQCTYPSGIARRRTVQILEARAMGLQLRVHKLTLASAHNLSLASTRLIERIRRIEAISAPILSVTAAREIQSPLYPSVQSEEVIHGDITEGYPPVIETITFQQGAHSYELRGFEDIPLTLSRHLIDLFLRYRTYFFFLMDPTYFLQHFLLPSSDPISMHPCLLNACYLGACIVGGKAYSHLEPFFLRRTRYFLQQSLMFVDRITHFLWSSVILGAYFARTRRMEECIAVGSAAAQLASACHLRLIHNAPYTPATESLLPPPKHEMEVLDRNCLSYSIYIIDQSLAMLFAVPATFPCDDWELDDNFFSQHMKSSSARWGGISRIWFSDEHLMASVMKTLERANRFARTASASEAAVRFNSNNLVAHAILYGSGLIVYSLRAREDSDAKAKMLQCVQALVDTAQKTHMMNAVRVLAHELQKPEAQENATLSTNHCRAIEALLEYLDDTIALYPAWYDAPVSLKDALTAAITALPI